MIYAIILIVIGLVAVIFNKKDITKRVTGILAWVALLPIIWGTVGIIILNTIRFSVFDESPIYWIFLIVGSAVQIIIGILFIYRHLKLRKDPTPNNTLFISQNVLGYVAILIGIATMYVK